ncbi:cold shock domain-containing protein E1-like isoform X2 [Ornithodoros turicata]|uniref:cold shock domain-containing protein E1-like isoform X2 n=1 Tax=Ornithodoros turicata TaxID=34597 RepID=UPI003139E3C0
MASSKWQNFSASNEEETDRGQHSGQNGSQGAKPSGGTFREAGIVEKLLHSYGFIRCCERQARLFFHYSQFSGNIEHLHLGDPVEFEMTYDRKSGKPIASSVVKISSEAISGEVFNEECVSGFITTEAKDGQEGRVAYENRGECFFLPYTQEDLEENVVLHPGDKASFYLATCKDTGALYAQNVRPAPSQGGDGQALSSPVGKSAGGGGLPRKQGVVCALKDTFGFIERADIVKEIFFHASECRDFRNLALGDDVEFTVQMRNNKEVACGVSRLPAGTVVFEDTSPEVLTGHIVTLADRRSAPSSGGNDPLPGRIAYTTDDKELEIPYGERDPRCDYTLQVGDQVQFSIATDRRDGLQRATNIELLDQSFNNENRLVDPASPNRFLATRIRRLSSESENTSMDSGGRARRTVANGDGLSNGSAGDADAKGSRKGRGARNGFRYTHRGYIAALKDSFGFIENEEHNQDVFFHFSVFEGNPSQLEPGQEVEYGLSHKGPKRSAECVRKLPAGTLAAQETVRPEIFSGVVERSVRCFNPDQEHYAGLVRLATGGEGEEIPAYEFGITSLTDKHDLLQKGDVVQFQVAVNSEGVERATNITAVRTRIQATVEAIKGQFGFLSYEAEEGKKLFFHMTEVKGGHLQVGDKVEFVVVHHQRTKKYSACSVVKIGESQPSQRPERLVSRLRTLSVDDAGPRIIIVRQPRGPDGTNGFASRITETEEDANTGSAEDLASDSTPVPPEVAA